MNPKDAASRIGSKYGVATPGSCGVTSFHIAASAGGADGIDGMPGMSARPPIQGRDCTPRTAGVDAATERSWLSDGVRPQSPVDVAGEATSRTAPSIERTSLRNENPGTTDMSGLTAVAGICATSGICASAGTPSLGSVP